MIEKQEESIVFKIIKQKGMRVMMDAGGKDEKFLDAGKVWFEYEEGRGVQVRED